MLELSIALSDGDKPLSKTSEMYTVKLADELPNAGIIPAQAESPAFVTQSRSATENKVNIMAIGDSITYGVINDGQTESGGYRTYLWQALTASGYDVNFVGSQANGPKSIDRNHEGYRGEEIEQIAATVNDRINKEKPDVVLLLAGTNDIIHDEDVDDAPQRLSALIDKLLRTSSQPTVLVATLPPNTRSGDDLQKIRDFNAALTEIVDRKIRQGKPVQLVDLYNTLSNSDLTDQTHPNARGYKKMAQTWYDALTDVLSRTDDTRGSDQHSVSNPSSDPLTGHVFTFSGVTKTEALRSSTWVGHNYDRLLNFNQQQGDRIQLDFDSNPATTSRHERPTKLFNAGIQIEKTLKRAVAAAYEDVDIHGKGNQKLKSNQAVIFQFGKDFYLSVNNHRQGFQAKSDLFVDLGRMTRADFAPGDFHAGSLTVTNYFV